jgi:hypothetical protein
MIVFLARSARRGRLNQPAAALFLEKKSPVHQGSERLSNGPNENVFNSFVKARPKKLMELTSHVCVSMKGRN